MDRRASHLTETVVVLVSVALFAAGSLAGNLAAATIPPTWKPFVLPALGVALVIEAIAALSLSRLLRFASEQDPGRRGRARQVATGVLLVVAELLAALVGLVSNLVVGSLPLSLTRSGALLFVGVSVLATLVVWLRLRGQFAPRVEETNRTHFLRNLHARYTARREDALRGVVLISLGLRQEPEALLRPALVVGTPADGDPARAKRRLLPAGTRITDVYDASAGHVLILGAPGAGKTTQLVELALALLGRGRADPTATTPFPVLFNLSSWAQNRDPLAAWLVDDLVYSYNVPPPIARSWVATHQILPLLDGLDEVEDIARDACVRAINHFVEIRPRVSLVVCSRSAEYRAQAVPLASLQMAVEVQPLTDQQIAAYLASGGQRWAALRAVVAADAELRDIVRTPLFLRLVTLTYADVSADVPLEMIHTVDARAAWQQQLFQDYVAKMLERERKPGAATSYTRAQTAHALAWLGWQLRRHRQAEFYLERLQPDWLLAVHTRRRSRISSGLVFGLLLGFLVGLGSGLVFGLLLGPGGGLRSGVLIGVFAGLGGGLLFGLGGRLWPALFPTLRWSWTELLFEVLFALLFGLVSLFIFGTDSGLLLGLLIGLLVGLLIAAGSEFGLGIGPDDERGLASADRRPTLRWSWTGLLFGLLLGLIIELFIWSLFGLGNGLLMGSLFGLGSGLLIGAGSALESGRIQMTPALRWYRSGLVSGLLFGLGSWMLFGLLFGLRSGLVFGLLFGLMTAFLTGLHLAAVDEHDYRMPAEGIRRSAQRGVLLIVASGLLFGLGSGLALGSLFGLAVGMLYGLGSGMVFGLLSGLGSGLGGGLVAAARHGVLRWQLRRDGVVPPSLVRFLDYAADRVLLQKIGGGYRFIHPLLRDYFADLYGEQETRHGTG
jgi:hypothetical protein